MKSKKINKMFTGISGVVSFMLFMSIASTPVYAAQKSEQTQTTSVTENKEESNEKNDYSTIINKVVEKDGFTVTLNSITSTKHCVKVTTTIKYKESFNEKSFDDIIAVATLQGISSDMYNRSFTKIDDNTIQFVFEINSINELPKSGDLRVDFVLPSYNLNIWVKDNIDLSKNFDKTIEKEISFDTSRYNFYKIESDVLGTTIYGNSSKNDDENLWDSAGSILLKYKDKLYNFERVDTHYSVYNDHTIYSYKVEGLTCDDIKDFNDFSIINIKCNIKNDDVEKMMNIANKNEKKAELDEVNNIKYSKDVSFSDGTSGEIYKVERNKDNVKLYLKSDSDKKTLLMANSLDGYCKTTDNNSDAGKTTKVMYKNPNAENEYIVEFGNVTEGAELNVFNDNVASYAFDKYEVEEEVKIN